MGEDRGVRSFSFPALSAFRAVIKSPNARVGALSVCVGMSMVCQTPRGGPRPLRPDEKLCEGADVRRSRAGSTPRFSPLAGPENRPSGSDVGTGPWGRGRLSDSGRACPHYHRWRGLAPPRNPNQDRRPRRRPLFTSSTLNDGDGRRRRGRGRHRYRPRHRLTTSPRSERRKPPRSLFAEHRSPADAPGPGTVLDGRKGCSPQARARSDTLDPPRPETSHTDGQRDGGFRSPRGSKTPLRTNVRRPGDRASSSRLRSDFRAEFLRDADRPRTLRPPWPRTAPDGSLSETPPTRTEPRCDPPRSRSQSDFKPKCMTGPKSPEGRLHPRR